KVIGAGVVEVDRALDEAQPQAASIEIKIAQGVPGDRCDVVQARHGACPSCERAKIVSPMLGRKAGKTIAPAVAGLTRNELGSQGVAPTIVRTGSERYP